MIGYRPLPGDEKILAPLSKEERVRLTMPGCKAWVKKLKAAGRVKSALARRHSAFMQAAGKGWRTRS